MAQACAVSTEPHWSNEKLMEDKASSKGGGGGTLRAILCGSPTHPVLPGKGGYTGIKQQEY